MKDKIITLGIVAILSIFLIIFFEKFIDFNPFKSAIKVSETFVNKLVGEEMELNKNTNKNNPLRIMPKSNKNRHGAAKGRPKVDFDCFLGGFGRIPKNYNFHFPGK